MTDTRTDRDYWDGTGAVLFCAALFAGPVAWAINQGFGYAVMKRVCVGADVYVLWLIALGALAVALGGVWTAWICLRRLRAVATDEGGSVVDRSYFVVVTALALDALFVLLILTSLVPQFVLSPCE